MNTKKATIVSELLSFLRIVSTPRLRPRLRAHKAIQCRKRGETFVAPPRFSNEYEIEQSLAMIPRYLDTRDP